MKPETALSIRRAMNKTQSEFWSRMIDVLDKFVAGLRETIGVDIVRPEFLMTEAPPAPTTKPKAKAKL